MADATSTPTAALDQDTSSILHAHSTAFWKLTILFFVVGDLATTAIGLSGGGVAEVGPLVGPILDRHGLLAMVPLKLLAVGVCYALWRLAPRPHAVGVPLGLACFGVLVTSWNTGVLFVAHVLT